MSAPLMRFLGENPAFCLYRHGILDNCGWVDGEAEKGDATNQQTLQNFWNPLSVGPLMAAELHQTPFLQVIPFKSLQNID